MFNKKKEAEIREVKQQLIDEWEKCFHEKVTNALTKQGLDCYWDKYTSVKEAAGMLTKAAILGFVNKVVEESDGDTDVTVIRMDDEGIEIFKPKGRYKVRRVDKDGNCVEDFDEMFDTEKDAMKFIRKQAMTTTHTIDEYQIGYPAGDDDDEEEDGTEEDN